MTLGQPQEDNPGLAPLPSDIASAQHSTSPAFVCLPSFFPPTEYFLDGRPVTKGPRQNGIGHSRGDARNQGGWAVGPCMNDPLEERSRCLFGQSPKSRHQVPIWPHVKRPGRGDPTRKARRLLPNTSRQNWVLVSVRISIAIVRAVCLLVSFIWNLPTQPLLQSRCDTRLRSIAGAPIASQSPSMIHPEQLLDIVDISSQMGSPLSDVDQEANGPSGG